MGHYQSNKVHHESDIVITYRKSNIAGVQLTMANTTNLMLLHIEALPGPNIREVLSKSAQAIRDGLARSGGTLFGAYKVSVIQEDNTHHLIQWTL